MTKRVLVLCPNAWDKAALSRARVQRGYELTFACEDLVETPSIWKGMRFDVFRLIRKLADTHRSSGLAGVVGTGDYPGCLIASTLAAELGLASPDPRDVILFSHKFYSREIQQRLVPSATPAFMAIDPRGDHEPSRSFGLPFFVKPVKGTMSIRARAVKQYSELRSAVRLSIRERILAHVLLKPFQQLLDTYSDGKVPAHFFIAEGMLSGHQVTVDGFVEDNKPVIMGVVDSVMYPGTMSFMRFDYPSRLPEAVQARMGALASALIEGSTFRRGCFNIEMFYDDARDSIHIIEVNPRMSYQFADLYEKVDGVNTYEAQLALSTREPVRWERRKGSYGAATSFVMRRFSDAEVVAVPSDEEIAEVTRRFPDSSVKVLCHVGSRLSSEDQDVGSYRYCIVNMGARNTEELFADYREVERMLTFSLR